MASGTITPAVSSTSDMLSSVPNGLFDNVSDTPDLSTTDDAVDTAEAGAEDNTFDTPDAIGDEPAEEPTEVEAAAEPEAEAAPEDKPATEEELPEGVRRGKDRKGKDGYFLEQNRYEAFHGNHKLVQQAAEMLGEPVTAEAIKLRNDAYLGQERLFTNLTSGDPALQTDVVKYMLREMTGERESGGVGIDPTVPFAQSVYSALKSDSPDGYANLRLLAARDLVGEIFEQAASTNNPHLFSSAQHFAATVAGIGPKAPDMTDAQYVAHVRAVTQRMGIPFYTPAEMQGLVKGEDPTARLARENADLRSQLNGRAQTGSAAQYDTWARSNIQTVNSAVLDDAVMPALASVADRWKEFPADYKRLVVDPLHRDVAAAVTADPVLNQQVADLKASAKRATSEQVRAQIGQRIRQLFVNRAKLAAERLAPPIVKFATDSLKGRSDITHERRAGAQARTAPKGTSAPVKRSLVPDNTGFKNNVFDSAAAVRQMQALLSR